MTGRPHLKIDDLGDAVHAAMQRLPSSDREILALVHWDGFSLVEVASILQLRPGAARMRYLRARDRLAPALQPFVRRKPTAAPTD